MAVGRQGASRSSTDTRAKLVTAAARQFLEVGYEASTVRSISTAADVTIGAFYGHFGSKREALYAVVRSLIRPASRKTPKAFSSPSHRALVFTVASFAHTDASADAVLREALDAMAASGQLSDSDATALTTLLVDPGSSPRRRS